MVPPSWEGFHLLGTYSAKYISFDFDSDSKTKYYHSYFTDGKPEAQER